MNNLKPEEKAALKMMQKDNFRGISKGNVMQLMSILSKVDPEVAKELIAQIPEGIRGAVEIEKIYAESLEKGIEEVASCTSSCFETEDQLIKMLQEEATKEDVTFEQKQYYYEKMAEAAIRKEAKDSENRGTIMQILKFGGEALALGLFVAAGIFIGKIDSRSIPRKWNH